MTGITLISFLLLASSFSNVEYITAYDGDTIKVNLPKSLFTDPGAYDLFGDHISVRVKGIDAPEIKGHCEKEKALAKQARDLVRQTLSHAKHINLMNVDRDKYFRILARVIADDVDISDMLLQKGLAVPYQGGHKSKDWCE